MGLKEGTILPMIYRGTVASIPWKAQIVVALIAFKPARKVKKLDIHIPILVLQLADIYIPCMHMRETFV